MNLSGFQNLHKFSTVQLRQLHHASGDTVLHLCLHREQNFYNIYIHKINPYTNTCCGDGNLVKFHFCFFMYWQYTSMKPYTSNQYKLLLFHIHTRQTAWLDINMGLNIFHFIRMQHKKTNAPMNQHQHRRPHSDSGFDNWTLQVKLMWFWQLNTAG